MAVLPSFAADGAAIVTLATSIGDPLVCRHMVTLLHPGVYVTEVPSGIRSIEGAATSTTIFVGETERGPVGPTKIASRSDYERLFGGYYRVREDSPPKAPTKLLTAYAM